MTPLLFINPAPEWSMRDPGLVFIAKFALFFSIPYVLIHLMDLGTLAGFVAGFEGWALGGQVAGSTILLAGMPYEIIADCTGLVMISMLAALLVAQRGETDKKLAAFALFAPVLFGFNLLRLWATISIGAANGPEAMEAAHLGFWMVDAGAVLLAWLVALKFVFRQRIEEAI